MPSSRRAVILLLAGVGITASGAAMSDAPSPSQCAVGVLREGVLPGNVNLRLGEPVEFDDGVGIASGRCAALFDGNQLLAWIHAYHQAGSRLFVQTCEKIADDGLIAPGSVSGAVSEEYVELVSTGGRPQLRALPAPMWSMFANPVFCRSHMAYWGTEFPPNQPMIVHALVYDLIGERVVKDRILGSILPRSDSRGFFERPRWSADARTVVFPEREDANGDSHIEGHQFELEVSGQ